jgi:hypothetical protein
MSTGRATALLGAGTQGRRLAYMVSSSEFVFVYPEPQLIRFGDSGQAREERSTSLTHRRNNCPTV